MTHIGQLSEAQLEMELTNNATVRGKTAPRITPQDVDNAIVDRIFWRVPDSAVTVCALRLRNGFVVIGKSAPASEVNFDADIGMRIAFDDARSQVWAFLGYALRDKLAGA